MPPNIVSKQTKSAPLRARDLRANIQELGYERGIEVTLTLLLDEFVGVRQAMQQLAEIQMQCIDQFQRMTDVGEEMKKRIESVKRSEEQFNEHRGSGIVPSRNE